MRIQYCSDLHLEFSQNLKWLKKNPIKPTGDILILAGDTIYLDEKYFKLEFFDWASDNFEEVYMLPGNHEYYGGFDLNNSYPSLDLNIRSNVKYVNNISILRGNYNIIFSTLWSNLKKNVEFISMSMADFHFNKWNGKPILTDTYINLHNESLKFLKTSIKNSLNKNIVVTHHAPSPLCYNSAIKDSFLTDAYCTDLSSFIKSNSIDYWIYGHCHWNHEKPIKIGQTTLLTNQLGYVHQGEAESFSLEKIIYLK